MDGLASAVHEMPLTTAERLAALRGKANQGEIAKAAGVAQTTYSNWENGINGPPAEAIARLAKYWGVTADYLVGLSDHRDALPPDSWVIDLDYVDAVRRGDGSHRRFGDQGAFAVPRRMQIISSVEYRALERDLAPLLRRAPGRGKGES